MALIRRFQHSHVHSMLAGCEFDQSMISISISATGEACGVSGAWPSCIVLRRFVIRDRCSRALVSPVS